MAGNRGALSHIEVYDRRQIDRCEILDVVRLERHWRAIHSDLLIDNFLERHLAQTSCWGFTRFGKRPHAPRAIIMS